MSESYEEVDEIIRTQRLKRWLKSVYPIFINLENVPEKFRHLSTLATKWGISDDAIRFELIDTSSDRELTELVEAVKPYHAELDEWLAAPDVTVNSVSHEYLVYFCLRMAADEAEIVLKRRHKAVDA